MSRRARVDLARLAAEQRGRRAERLAKWFLRLKGYRILGERIRVRGGEVDIVARHGRTIVFAEVKARPDETSADAAIDAARLTRVRTAAHQLWPRYAKGADGARIDAVLIMPRRWPVHLKDI
ncbi:MAG: YraN family protein [Pacificimonas sp.]|jgi:putative endonuclease|nr:YraN family protein [Pacificimonas sp.]